MVGQVMKLKKKILYAENEAETVCVTVFTFNLILIGRSIFL